MKTIYNIPLIFVLVLIGQTAMSQQIIMFNNDIINPVIFNPSKVAANGNNVFFQHRNQWVGIEGAPTLSLVSTDWKLDKINSGIGLVLKSETAGIFKTTGGYVNYAKHLQINENQKLSLGLAVGVANIGIDYNQIVSTQEDPLVPNYARIKSRFDASFGLSYQVNKFQVNISALQLMGNKKNLFQTSELDYLFTKHFMFNASYDFEVGSSFKLKPIVQFKSVQGLTVNPEVILMLNYKDVFWVAGHYNHQRSTALTFGVLVDETFTIGYSAEFSNNSYVTVSGGTHELVFGIKLDQLRNKKGGNPPNLGNSKIASYDERMEFMKLENEQMEAKIKKQQKQLEELKNQSKGLSYDEVKIMIEKANQSNVKPIVVEKEAVKAKLMSKAKSIQFNGGNSVLTNDSKTALDDIAKLLKEEGNVKLLVKGYTDDRGDVAQNKQLSQERADAVKKYLLSKGIQNAQVQASGYGIENPITSNNTAKGRQQNRRVELEIVYP